MILAHFLRSIFPVESNGASAKQVFHSSAENFSPNVHNANFNLEREKSRVLVIEEASIIIDHYKDRVCQKFSVAKNLAKSFFPVKQKKRLPVLFTFALALVELRERRDNGRLVVGTLHTIA